VRLLCAGWFERVCSLNVPTETKEEIVMYLLATIFNRVKLAPSTASKHCANPSFGGSSLIRLKPLDQIEDFFDNLAAGAGKALADVSAAALIREHNRHARAVLHAYLTDVFRALGPLERVTAPLMEGEPFPVSSSSSSSSSAGDNGAAAGTAGGSTSLSPPSSGGSGGGGGGGVNASSGPRRLGGTFLSPFAELAGVSPGAVAGRGVEAAAVRFLRRDMQVATLEVRRVPMCAKRPPSFSSLPRGSHGLKREEKKNTFHFYLFFP
jgi:hypothetical protein